MSAPTYELSAEGVSAALAALGSTVEQVTATLLAGGHLGVPEACNACPVARYLIAVLPDSTVEVHASFASAWQPGGSSLSVQLPRAAAFFVALFDRGQIPALREHPFADPAATS